MAQSYTTLRTLIQTILDDTGVALWSTAVLDLYMADALREMALYVPYEVKKHFTIESRTGTATADTSSALVDTTESQFVSADVGKIVHNNTDNTWAVVTAFVSSSQLTLSKDIMDDGNEEYEIFNADCWNNRQIKIADVTDRIRDPIVAEYPIGSKRNITVNNDILELDMVINPDDSKVLSSGNQPDVLVYVYFDKRHKLSQLTDFAGAVNNAGGYAAGSTSMAINGLQSSGTVEADQEFTVAGIRGTYRVTTAATISSNAATITFYPGLESAAENADVVTFKQSSLTPEMEPVFANLVAGRAAIAKARSYIGTFAVGSKRTAQELESWGQRMVEAALARLRRMSPMKSTSQIMDDYGDK